MWNLCSGEILEEEAHGWEAKLYFPVNRMLSIEFQYLFFVYYIDDELVQRNYWLQVMYWNSSELL